MVRIPSLSRRSEPAPTRDENLDGRIDGRDTPVDSGRESSAVTGVGRSDDSPGRPVVTDRAADQTTYRSATATDDQAGDAGEAERRATERAAVARAATARPVEGETRRPDPEDRVATDRPVSPAPERTEPPVTRGPKPRASLLATFGLIVAVAGALFVLTGALAGYGIGLGALGAVLSVLGLSATRRRHVAGKTDALFGVLIGLAAVVLGVLAMTGQFDWPTTDGDWVQRFREWLDSQFVDRF
ncbi:MULTISPECIES: DMT family transporter [unclassified Micromonospora]|uniref:DMT family transporter n=1 Tax=unclassified Micromonospora TaxID=2617518 RepID=UPI002E20CCA0|nr:DMT family transporter [Micromonospora sp. NBC_00858]